MVNSSKREALGRRKSKRVTLADVAAKAGVSAITASRVVNDYPGVRAQLRQKVEAAINELGYIPNRSASALASSRSKIIGVLIPSLSNVVFNDVLRGIYDLAVPAKYQVFLADTHYSAEEEQRSIRSLISLSPEAMIITGGDQTSMARRTLESAGIPVVQIMDKLAQPIDMNIGFSHSEAGVAVANMLLEKGYQRVGFIGARMDPRTCDRLAGFKAALTRASKFDPTLVVTSNDPSSLAKGAELMRELLAHPGISCDAVFCCNDDLALGALQACKAMHIDVPGAFGICGFNDIEMAGFCSPPLTSVRVSRYQMGYQAMEMVFARLEGIDVPDRVDSGFEIIFRESTR